MKVLSFILSTSSWKIFSNKENDFVEITEYYNQLRIIFLGA
jgi:hypothetical protein